ncbi:akuammiline synthase 1-like [Bidens hawaiensis]|uniref:akuammiline synthase 1-like n=1 Tax=Bidens hawaiensis TaxID=980011 RepID=UPI00404A231E
MLISKLLRVERRRLHTIVSRELIQPSSPTPCRSKIYNLSLLDQISLNSHTPIVAFYQNLDQSSLNKTLELKNSLPKTLTHYYPFAGRVRKTSPTYVDCNDEGVEYIEASNDNSLSNFLKQSEHEDFDPLFPNDLIWFNPRIRGDTEGVTCPLAVQVTHFACGGVAVATTLFHKVGDARTMFNFIDHWAAMNAKKDTSPISPQIISHQARNINLPDILSEKSNVGCVTRSFMFPNQKLNDLKAKVTAMTIESGQPIKNPTRIEVLSWLLHNRATAATTKNNAGTFKASGMVFPTDMRSILVEKLPGTSIGNLVFVIEVPTRNQRELAPHFSIGEMRKMKAMFHSVPNLEAATKIVAKMSPEIALETLKRVDEYYIYSSLCRIPTYDIDFGWGKPVKVTFGGTIKNLTLLMAAPDGNGIEASMCLEKEDMEILQNDPELLAFC